VAIGVTGVVGSQRITLQAAEEARRFDMASNIAHEWVARLQRDASAWTSAPGQPLTASDLEKTRWLQKAKLNECTADFCGIEVPSGNATGLSPAFDMFGRDLNTAETGADQSQARYCVQFRFTNLSPTNDPQLPMSLLRVDLRVYWSRFEVGQVGNCNTPPNPATAARFQILRASTAVRPATP